jgi:hypothetical protein
MLYIMTSIVASGMDALHNCQRPTYRQMHAAIDRIAKLSPIVGALSLLAGFSEQVWGDEPRSRALQKACMHASGSGLPPFMLSRLCCQLRLQLQLLKECRTCSPARTGFGCAEALQPESAPKLASFIVTAMSFNPCSHNMDPSGVIFNSKCIKLPCGYY